MARGSIRGLVDPIVSVVRLSINFDDDCHHCILVLHSVILDDGVWVWNCLQDGVGRYGTL